MGNIPEKTILEDYMQKSIVRISAALLTATLIFACSDGGEEEEPVNTNKAVIKYGTPDISKKGSDPNWKKSATYGVNKVFEGDSADYFIATPDTSGVARVLFDENGLWVYVEVTDPIVHTTEAVSNWHLYDSVELFINENVNVKTAGYANQGGQYRLGALDEASGDPAAAADSFSELNKHTAWTTSKGYAVIFQAPWRFKDQYPIDNGKKIGFDIQINACDGEGTRDGVVVVYNIAHGNYQNANDYGEVELDGGGHVFTINAQTPSITAQPASVTYDGSQEAPVLSITAAVTDGGTLTYQWYSNTANSAANGTAISGATSAAYTPPVDTEGSTFYYAVITNTNNSVNGEKVRTITSSIAKVEVVASGVELVEKIAAAASSVPVYRFTPAGNEVWSDYKKITFTILVADEGSYNHLSARAHIAGNYAADAFDAAGVHSAGDWGSERILNIANGNADQTINNILEDPGLNKWIVLEYETSTFSGSTAPVATTTGPFYFGLGFTLNPNNLGDDNKGDAVEYYIKDVALVKEDGTKLLADDLATTFGSTTLGQLWCKFNVDFGAVTRSMEPAPTE
jgi:hypothetical protein